LPGRIIRNIFASVNGSKTSCHLKLVIAITSLPSHQHDFFSGCKHYWNQVTSELSLIIFASVFSSG